MSFIFRLLIACHVLASPALYAVGLGNEMGPFCLQVQGFLNTNRAVTLDNPVCYAMSAKKMVVMTVAIDEAINNQTYMNYIKKLTIEPYIYGIDRNQQPVLCGNVVRTEIIRQQSLRYGAAQVASAFGGLDPKFTAMIIWKPTQNVGPVNVWKVLDVQINNSAAYMARQDIMQQFPTQGLNVICSTLPMIAQPQTQQPFEQQSYPAAQPQAVPQYQYQQPAQQYQQPTQQYQQPQQQNLEPAQTQQDKPERLQPYVPPTWTGPNY